jgi:hypothetical protein
MAEIYRASKEGKLVDKLRDGKFGAKIKKLQDEWQAENCPCDNYQKVYGHDFYNTSVGKILYGLTENVGRAMWRMGWKFSQFSSISRFMFDHQSDLKHLFFSENVSDGYCQKHWTDIMGHCWNYKKGNKTTVKANQ